MKHKIFTIEEQKLLDSLGRGESAARTQSEITAITGYDGRTTRKILERARKRGAVVCGSDAGRYLPETLDELKRYVKRVESQLRSEGAALQAARRLLRQSLDGDNFGGTGNGGR